MLKSLLSTLLLLSALTVNALPAPAPQSSDTRLMAERGLHLIDLEDGTEPVWRTEEQVLDFIRAGTNFFDVTDTYEAYKKIEANNRLAKVAADDVSVLAYPTPSHQTQVRAILATMTSTRMQSWLTTLTNFNNRYYTSSTGVAASTWIRDTAQGIATQYGRSDVEVSLFTHSWAQPSIIARIPGSNPSAPRVLLGSHMDSINSANPSGRAPGADDDGTGTVNLLEAFRALLEGGFRPTATVEFQWYAAEEVGLRGSQAIATQYKNNGVQVAGHFQLDMTGYFTPGTKEVMALAPDYINAELNEFSKKIITEYAGIPWAMDRACGYACSDHASFYRVGFPTTYPFEAVTGNDNPNIHSASDTTSVRGFSWSHSLEFAKVAAAWAYELAA